MGLARIGYEPEGNAKRRRLKFFAVICATLTALAVGGFGALGAGAGPPPPETNTGTIKIFDGDKELPANDPKAGCDFTVRGINFDPGESVLVTIEGQGGNAGPGSFAQTVTVLGDGSFSTMNIHNFPDGQYKANADDGEGGGDKNKVFKVECVPVTPPTQAPPTGPPGEQAAPPGPAAAPSAPQAPAAARPAQPSAPAAAPPPAAAVAGQARGITG